MKIDCYYLTSTSALFLRAGASIPSQFAEQKPRPGRRDVFFDNPALIADIENQGWHVRSRELDITIEVIGSQPK